MKNGFYEPASAHSEDGKFVWRDIKRMDLSKKEFELYQLLPGDLLVNRVNSREIVGKAAMIPKGLEPCVFESKNIRLRLRIELVEPKFAAFKLLLDGSRQFANNAQRVVGMASISQPQLGSFPISPPPINEQKRLGAKIETLFSELDAGEESLRRARRQLGVHRQSLLKQAFTGQLVPQDPNDEPAASLVQRLHRAGAFFARPSPIECLGPLLAHSMNPTPPEMIQDLATHEAALRLLGDLMQIDPAPGSAEELKIKRLAIVIEEYEKRTVRLPMASHGKTA